MTDLDKQLACQPLQVRVEGDERWFDVPADKSILQVLVDAGYNLPSNCERGQCGTCVAWVIEGLPDHRDTCLLPAAKAAGDLMLICVSRALTPRLVIAI